MTFATPQKAVSPHEPTEPSLSDQPSSEDVNDEGDGSTTNAEQRDSLELSSREPFNVSDTTTPDATQTMDEPNQSDGRVDLKGNKLRRHSSVSSVTIQTPRNLSLPQGNERNINRGRLRKASPKPNR